MPSAIFAVDSDKNVVSWNRGEEELTGFSAQEIIGKKCRIFANTPCGERCGLYCADVIKPIINKECTIRRKDGQIRNISKNADIMKDSNGNIIGGIETLFDTTEMKESEFKIKSLLKDKELLLKEVHHRIKNNMAAVIGILDLHAIALQATDSHAVSAINDASSCLRSMCVLYDKLYRSESLTSISIKLYLESLAEQLISNFPNSDHVTLKKELEEFMISANISFALGIIVNEILTNTMKYAFEGREAGSITISALKRGGKAVVVIHDDWIGIPEDFDIVKSTGFGMNLVKMMTEQLGGTIEIQSSNGTKTTLIFPL